MDSNLFEDDPISLTFPEIVGQDEAKKQLKSALVMGRHVVMVGPPGTGKTTLARSIAKRLRPLDLQDCSYHCSPTKPLCSACLNGQTKTVKVIGTKRFIRVQGSPELTAEDLIGDIDPVKALAHGPLSKEAFTPGKLFRANNGVLFFDEINRASEKLQNALLQVLEERKATIGSYEVDFPADIILIGTMNPEDNSTQPLSDVFLDRFDMIGVTYPTTIEEEREILLSKQRPAAPKFPDDLLTFVISLVQDLRKDEQLEKHPGVRATIGLYERSLSNAFLGRRAEVTLEDIKASFISVIAHRIRLKPSARVLTDAASYLEKRFSQATHNLPGGDR